MKRKSKIVKITESEFRKLNLKIKICEWENIGNNTRKLVINEYSFNDKYLTLDNIDFYKKLGVYDKPFMVAFHKSVDNINNNVNIFCEKESYLIKNYNNQHENYVCYPYYMSRKLNGNYYYMICSGELIKIPYNETEVIYLIEWGK